MYLFHILSSDPLCNEHSVYMITECTNIWFKPSKMNLKDHQERIVTSARPLSKDGESSIAEYCGTCTHRPSCHTHPIIDLTPYSVLHKSHSHQATPLHWWAKMPILPVTVSVKKIKGAACQRWQNRSVWTDLNSQLRHIYDRQELNFPQNLTI